MNTEHRKSQVTLPGLSFKDREIAYVRIETPLVRSERNDELKEGEKPATVCKITNLQDGKLYRLICPALMVSALMDEGTDYVGKSFEIIVSSQPKPGKRYKEVEVYEIDPAINYSQYPTRLGHGQETNQPAQAAPTP